MDANQQAAMVPSGNVRDETCIPVTVAMLMKSYPPLMNDEHVKPNALVLEDGRPLHKVRLVAAVRNFAEMSTTVTYQVEDGTGVIEVRQWIDNTCSYLTELRRSTMKENIYVKIYGYPKLYEGRREIRAESIRPIKTGNEISHHFLEVIHTGETYIRRTNDGKPPDSSKSGPEHNMDDDREVAAPEDISSSRMHIREAVIAYISVVGDDNGRGADVTELVNSMVDGGQFSRTATMSVIRQLVSECVIFQTSEDHLLRLA